MEKEMEDEVESGYVGDNRGFSCFQYSVPRLLV